MKPLPTLILTANHWHFDAFGGAYKLASEFALYCAQNGYPVYYVCGTSEEGLTLPEVRSGVCLRRYLLPKDSGKGKSFSNFVTHIYRSREQIKKILKQIGDDQGIIINGHSGLQHFGAFLGTGRRRSVRKVLSVHSPMVREYQAERADGEKSLKDMLACCLIRMTEGYCYRNSDVIQCDSEYTRRLLENEFPKDVSGRLVVCPGYVDLKRFRLAGDSKLTLRKKLSNHPVWNTNETVFFCLRRLVPRMGIDRLIRAAAWLKTARPGKAGFKVMIGGEGPLRESLEKLAEALGLKGIVCFLGRIPDEELPLHYQAADRFVLPTRELECFGLIILESFACGIPVIATPVGSIPEILGPFSKWSLADDADPESIGKAMLRSLETTPPSAEELARYASKFGHQEILARLASVVIGRNI